MKKINLYFLIIVTVSLTNLLSAQDENCNDGIRVFFCIGAGCAQTINPSPEIININTVDDYNNNNGVAGEGYGFVGYDSTNGSLYSPNGGPYKLISVEAIIVPYNEINAYSDSTFGNYWECVVSGNNVEARIIFEDGTGAEFIYEYDNVSTIIDNQPQNWNGGGDDGVPPFCNPQSSKTYYTGFELIRVDYFFNEPSTLIFK